MQKFYVLVDNEGVIFMDMESMEYPCFSSKEAAEAYVQSEGLRYFEPFEVTLVA